MSEAIVKDIEGKMKKTVEALRTELSKIRGARASVTLLDPVRVDYYGQMMPINQLANVSTPEPRSITITPWDKGAIAPIEKAIQQSDIGITPINDGNVIRLNMPPLTEERRKDLVKAVKKHAEDYRVALRNVRRDGLDVVKNELKTKKITEDDEKRLSKKVQDLTDQFNRDIDTVIAGKEKDIMTV